MVKDLASAIKVKPFKVVAELLALDQFKNADEEVDFETASIIARKHGYRAQRPPPGVLVRWFFDATVFETATTCCFAMGMSPW